MRVKTSKLSGIPSSPPPQDPPAVTGTNHTCLQIPCFAQIFLNVFNFY